MNLNLTEQLNEILKDYTDEVREVTFKTLESVGKEAAKELRKVGDFNGTKYKKSWSSTVERKRTHTSVTVYNKKYYRLTHLLENGHRKVGKKGGFVDAKPHIAPVNEKYQEKAVEEIIKAIESIK